MPVNVPKAVYDGILAVRDSGATNMLDRPRVIELLDEMGFDESAEWVHNHKSDYSHGVFQGFKATEDATTDRGGEA